jgi:mutator protein MutT
MKRIDVAIAVICRALFDGKTCESGGKSSVELLICQRKQDDSFGGYWEFPGGKCETGETLEECLSRELREELDITARPVETLSPISHDYPSGRFTLHPFLCEHISGEPRLIECQQVKWITPGELANYRFPPANETLIAEIMKRLIPNA